MVATDTISILKLRLNMSGVENIAANIKRDFGSQVFSHNQDRPVKL